MKMRQKLFSISCLVFIWEDELFSRTKKIWSSFRRTIGGRERRKVVKRRENVRLERPLEKALERVTEE